MLTSDQTAFRQHAVALARQTAAEYGLDWRLMAATAILESGWGESDLARHAHNLFGIKAGASTPDDQSYAIASPAGPRRFRKYDSDEAAFKAYGRLVGGSSFYAPARQAARDAALEAFARRLAPVYCPDDPDYALKIMQIAAMLE